MPSSTQIGSAAVVLTANADGLTNGLAEAQAKVNRWSAGVERSLGTALKVPTSTVGDKLSLAASNETARVAKTQKAAAKSGDQHGVLAQAGGALGRGLGFTAVTAGATGLAVAIGGAVKGLETLDRLAAVGRTAQAFGMSTEAATGLFGVMEASGSDIRDATEGLVTLGQRVTDAMSGSGEQAAKLFDGLGVKAESFAGLDPAEQFYRLHDSLLKVADPAQRVQLLLQAVGEDTGKNLIGTLSLSNAELRKQAAGFSVSAASMAQVVQANQSVTAATAKMSQAWDQIVIAMAPVAEFFADLIPVAVDALTAKFGGFGEFVVPALHGVAIGAGNVWDSIKAGAGGIAVVAASITDTFAGLLGSIREPLTQFVAFMSDQFADMVQKIRLLGTGLSKFLPDNMKPAWLDGFNENLATVEDKFRNTGDTVRNNLEQMEQRMKTGAANVGRLGGEWIGAWGQTGAKIDAEFQEWSASRERKLAAVTAGLNPAASLGGLANGPSNGGDIKVTASEPLKLAGALEKWSASAYSAIVQSQLSDYSGGRAILGNANNNTSGSGGSLTPSNAYVGSEAGSGQNKELLRAIGETNRRLDRVIDVLKDRPPAKVI